MSVEDGRAGGGSRGVIEIALEALFSRGLALRGRRVTVVVPDATRPLDPEMAVAPLLARLADHGARIRVLVALGLHRPMRASELEPLARTVGVFGVPLEEHSAVDPAKLVEIGPAIASYADGRGPPLPRVFSRRVVEADLSFSVGLVEPHQYAGFSGGAKTIAIGCAGAATIAAMHGLTFLRDPDMRLAKTDANPFHAALWRLVADLPECFALQVVPVSDRDGAVFASAGPTAEAFARARRVALRETLEPVSEPLDYAHLSVPAAKAQSFYQASRAATYVALIDRPAIKRGGLILLEAPCPEGIGTGRGEQACADAMMLGRTALLEILDGQRPSGGDATEGGAQRAYVLARALEAVELVVVGAPEIPALAAMGIRQRSTIDAAFRLLDPAAKGATFADVFRRVPFSA